MDIEISEFTPTIISDNHLLIVGYAGGDNRYKEAYKLPVTDIKASIDQQHNSNTPTKWTK